METSHTSTYTDLPPSGFEKPGTPWSVPQAPFGYHKFARQMSPQAPSGDEAPFAYHKFVRQMSPQAPSGDEDPDLDEIALPDDLAWTRMITADCWDVAEIRLGQLGSSGGGLGAHLPGGWPSLAPPPGFSCHNLASTAEESLGSAEEAVATEKTSSSHGADSSTCASGTTEKSDRPPRVRGGRRRRGTGSLVDIAKRRAAQQATGTTPPAATDLSEIVARRLATQGLATPAQNTTIPPVGPSYTGPPAVPLVPSFCPYCGCRAQAPFRFCANCGISLHKLNDA